MPQSRARAPLPPGYKWIALSNTTLGTLMASINSSIILISLPAIFRGIGVNPLAPEETGYLLWMLLGYMVVTAVFLVACGRISDIFGRVRLYNAGFAVFTLGSLLLFLAPGRGNTGAMELVLLRLLQGLGAAFLFANSNAILTDAFPAGERGLALGLNQIAFTGGSLLGLLLGGVMAADNWRLVFLVSVPVGLIGTVWAYLMLRETAAGGNRRARIDYLGNVTFALGLTSLLVGVTYGIMPYGHSNMGWGNPLVRVALAAGVAVLAAFVWIESRVPDPMFRLSLFRIRVFSAGNFAGFMGALARGGLQFMLIIWLQGVWLPLHGYSFEVTPLWAGIYMMPLMIGFMLVGPVSGRVSDRLGARGLTTVGMLIMTACFLGLAGLPADFSYPTFAALIGVMGCGMGLFSAPNTSSIMSSLPPEHRGAGSGMISTFMNAGAMCSMGVFFSIAIVGLGAGLPAALHSGLVAAGLAPSVAQGVAHLPPTAALFAAFLGYNPMKTLVPAAALTALAPAAQAHVLAPNFFPGLIATPFMTGMRAAFTVSAVLALVGAIASWFREGRPARVAAVTGESTGARLAGGAGGSA